MSARDVWVYNSSEDIIRSKAKSMIDVYNTEVLHYMECNKKDENILFDSTRISWSSSLISCLKKREYIHFNTNAFRVASYRPFFKQKLYFGPKLIHRRGQWDLLFPTPQSKNLVICASGVGSKTFSALMTDNIPDIHILESATQCFPLYYYEANQAQTGLYETQKDSEYTRHDGISDFALESAQALYSKKVSKEDIFYYIYGLLHSPEYRARFKADLTKMLPRIAFVEDIKAFRAIVKIGEKLADLHLNYETVEPYQNVIVTVEKPIYTVEQMRFARRKDEKGKTIDDKRTIIVNRYIKIEEIPLQAYEYVVNGKSPLEWALERYSYTVDKKSGITNDPNAWGNEHNDPQYILNLLLRLITVSVETVKLVAKLPKLDFIKD